MNFSRNSRGRKGPIDFDLELTVCSYNQIFFPFLARVDCRIYSKIHRAKYFIRKDLIDIFDEKRLIPFFYVRKIYIFFIYTDKDSNFILSSIPSFFTFNFAQFWKRSAVYLSVAN